MRTRATGQSPGGFHVLASPKRVRRQPPPPVRSSRNPSKVSEVEKIDVSLEHHATVSNSTQKNSRSNGDASYHPSYQKEANGIDTTLKTMSLTKSVGECDSESMLSKQKRDNHDENVKNSGAKKRGGSSKKTKLEHNFIKGASSQFINDVGGKNNLESEPNTNPHDILRDRARPILGKRQRSISSDNFSAPGNKKETSNLKRTRVDYNNKTLSGLATAEYSITVPQNHSEPPQFALNNGHNSHFKLIEQAHDKTNRDNRPVDLKSPHQRSREKQREQMAASSLTSSSCAHLTNQNPKNSRTNFGSHQKKDVETHLKLGMQSIMSRMNKYQYQPLPKKPCKTLSETSLAAGQVLALDAKKGQGVKYTKSPSISPISPTIENTRPQLDILKTAPNRDFDNNSFEKEFCHQKQNSGEPNLLEGDETKKIPENIKDRRLEVEKLFRSTAPDASYQNILRAVAEWAVHNSSKLPTKDEIFTYIESSKAPDATELFSTTTGIFPRASPSKLRKVSETSNSLSKSMKNKNIKNNNCVPNSRTRNFTSNQSTDKKGLVSHHATSNSNEIQRAPHVTTHNMEDRYESIPSPETPSNSKTQPAKSLVSQSWGLVSTFKNIVSTPFKVLSFGFGFNESNVAVQDVTRDIDFAFKPSATQPPPIISSKKERPVSKKQIRYQTPGRAVQKNKPKYLPFDHSSYQDSSHSLPTVRQVVTEKRKFELQHELELKKSKIRERNLNHDTDRRHKRPNNNLKRTQSHLDQDSHARPSQSSQQTIIADNAVEEWPPNLDPNRKVMDLTMASQNLPCGPNGEDVASMLCKGWLISKHRDSFIREIKDLHKVQSFTRKSLFVPTSGNPIENDSSGICNVSRYTNVKNVEENTENETKTRGEITRITQPGRSYGFDYDDDSSSSDEENPIEKEILKTDVDNSSSKETEPVSSQVKLGIGPHSSPIKDSDKANSAQLSEKIDKKSSPPSCNPCNPGISSTLRHVEAQSSFSANLEISSTQPTRTPSPTLINESQALMVLNDKDLLSQSTGNISDWSYMCDVDPRMAHFNPGIIDAVESLPKDSFPGVQLPSLIEELI